MFNSLIIRGLMASVLIMVIGALSMHLAVGADKPAINGDVSIGKITILEEGIQIDGGTMGLFTLSFPTLTDSTQKTVHPEIEKRVGDNKASIRYEGGASLEINVNDAGEVTLAFADVPMDVQSFNGRMILSKSFGDGGSWKMDDGPETPFPNEKPAKPHLYQGHSRTLTLKGVEGGALTITTPQYTFQQLADNREWNWNVFEWDYSTPVNHDHNSEIFILKLTVNHDNQPARRVILVDALGQNARVDFPDKFKSVEDLKVDAISEKDYYDSLHPPVRDLYGGLPGSGERLALNATGYFHVQQKREKWHLVDPAGNLFYAMGVCSFEPVDDYTYVAGRESIYAWLPPAAGEFATAYRANDEPGTVFSFHLANQIRKYGKPYDPDEYQRRMFTRLRKWGMNCVGPFSTPSKINQEMNVPYFCLLPISKWTGFPSLPGVRDTWDPFEPKNVDLVRNVFEKHLPERANDPLLIGYYLNNEPQYEALPKVLPQLDGTKFVCKRKFVDALQAKYHTIAAFNAAWNAKALSFESLVPIGIPVTTPMAEADVADFADVFFDAYYKLIHDTYKQYDSNHMLLGNRFQPVTINNQRLMTVAGKYLDVMSFNYYTHTVDTDFLKKIHTWSGKPLLLSEWFYDSPSDSGLRGLKDVASQEQRGLAYRNYVEQTAATGFVVGETWFLMVDQAATGRYFEKYSGESSNAGLIAVTDRPWKTLLDQAMKTNYTIYDLIQGQRQPFAWNEPGSTGKGE